MLEQLDLTLVPLVIVEALHFIVGFNGVATDEEVDEEGFVEWVLQLECSTLVRSNLDASEVDKAINYDVWLSHIGGDRNLDAAHDVGFNRDDGSDILDHAVDPVAFDPGG